MFTTQQSIKKQKMFYTRIIREFSQWIHNCVHIHCLKFLSCTKRTNFFTFHFNILTPISRKLLTRKSQAVSFSR